jgi:hypothetical protein
MFLLFDHLTVSTFLDSDEVSEVGGSDAEFGFSEPLFLAEKNVYSPAQKKQRHSKPTNRGAPGWYL